MKKHLLRLAFCCLILLMLPVMVMAEEQELPTEWVRYGYGLPDPAPVPMHELGQQDITLEGVAYETTIRDGRIYVRLGDLACAKLLRENTAKAEQLGLSYDSLKIAEGKIQLIQQDAAAAEKLAEFLSGAGIGVCVGDEFILADGGTDKLIVRIAGFAAKPEEDKGPAKTGEPGGLDVKAYPDGGYKDVLIPEKNRPEITTVYVNYLGETTYDSISPSLQSNEESEQEEQQIRASRCNCVDVFLAYSQWDLDNGVTYYVSIVAEDEEGNGFVIDPDSRDLIPERQGEAADVVGQPRRFEALFRTSQETSDEYTLPVIRISTDKDFTNIVKTIRLKDMTPGPDGLVEVKEDRLYVKENAETPDGYTKDAAYDQTTLNADESCTVTGTPLIDDEVTVEVRDDVVLEAYDPTQPS